jgi:hypothetical protein
MRINFPQRNIRVGGSTTLNTGLSHAEVMGIVDPGAIRTPNPVNKKNCDHKSFRPFPPLPPHHEGMED